MSSLSSASGMMSCPQLRRQSPLLQPPFIHFMCFRMPDFAIWITTRVEILLIMCVCWIASKRQRDGQRELGSKSRGGKHCGSNYTAGIRGNIWDGYVCSHTISYSLLCIQGQPVVAHSLVKLSSGIVGGCTVVVCYAGIRRVQLNGSGEVGDGAPLVPHLVTADTTIEVGVHVGGVQLQQYGDEAGEGGLRSGWSRATAVETLLIGRYT